MISYLPLAHMYERVVENMVFQFGARVGFFRGDIKKLGDDIKELKPTFVPLVPRILTRIFDAVRYYITIAINFITRLLVSRSASALTKS